jgi:flagellar protein FliO/FliZ
MDVIDLARYVGALLLVLALVGFAALAARRYGLPGFVHGTAQRRLAVVESLMLGPRHKLVLLRRDGAEHLVLIGPDGASVVESGFARETPARAASAAEASSC